MKRKPEKNPVYSGIVMKDLDCRQCGMRFSVQDSFYYTVITGGDAFYCPRGHCLEHAEGAKKKREQERIAREAKLEEERKEKARLEELVKERLWYKITHIFD